MTMKFCKTFSLALAAASMLCSRASAADQAVTTVRITDKVILPDSSRFGFNVSSDNYYSPAVMNRRLTLNFEAGHINGFTLWQPKNGETETLLPLPDKSRVFKEYTPAVIDTLKTTGTVTILQDPLLWTETKILDVKQIDGKWYLEVDKKIPVPEGKNSFAPMYMFSAVDRKSTEQGRSFNLIAGKGKEDQFCISLNDVPPGSAGWRALRVNGSQKKAADGFALTTAANMDCVGDWKVTLWAKAVAGTPKFGIGISDARQDVPVTAEWKKVECVLKVANPESGWVALHIEVSGGDLLLDDIEVIKLGMKNPTAFTDDFVAMMKDDLKIGSLRQLMMFGNGVEDYLQPRVRQLSGQFPWTATEYYSLCEYIGAEPWFSLPGYVHPKDMKVIAEYLGAPADIGFGKLRAEQGHPKPWTEVFKRIHLQIANEPITFNGSSPHVDTWRSLAETLKSSPYYKPNIRFTASSQDISTGNWLSPQKKYRGFVDNPAKIDQICDAPYFLTGCWKSDIEAQKTPADLFQWVATFSQANWDERGARWKSILEGTGIELVSYETSYHTTFGDATSQQRNGIITSMGGGISQLHNLLYPMKQFGVRTAEQFNLYQFDFSPGGSFGDDFEGKKVRLWGTVLNNRIGQQRYRPIALAIRVANEVIGGDLVETIQEGANPTYSVAGRWKDTRGEKMPEGKRIASKEEPTQKTNPAVWSYAFKEGKRRGLILMNLNGKDTQMVNVVFEGKASSKGAQTWELSNPDLYASNEPELKDPQVSVKTGSIPGFASGKQVQLAPFSVMSMEWELE